MRWTPARWPKVSQWAAPGAGEFDLSWSTLDADAVALVAIQGLYEMAKEKVAEIAALRAEMEDRIAQLEQKLAELILREREEQE